METAVCQHKLEKITSLRYGVELHTCSNCHQEVQTHIDKLKEPPTVVKLGRINGAIVLPNPTYKLLLTPQDQADLTATQEAAKKKAEERIITVPRERQKWYNKNKRAMIDDLITMSQNTFLEKWKVPRQLISHLKSDPYYKKKVARVPIDIPALPPWRDEWSPEVQVEWLRTYREVNRIYESR